MKGKTIRTLLPGQPGTKKWEKQYGDKLICIRYRYEEKNKKKMKTIEIIVDERTLKKNDLIPHNKIVFVRIEYGEINLAMLVKNAGGIWNKNERAWELPYASVIALGLENRIKKPKNISIYKNIEKKNTH